MGIYNSDKKDYEELFKEKMNEAKLMHNLSDENKRRADTVKEAILHASSFFEAVQIIQSQMN